VHIDEVHEFDLHPGLRSSWTELSRHVHLTLNS
jgi:hypothetical protein